MPGFQPNEHYVREMKRYGVLPASLELDKDPIDVYAADRAYFETFWYRSPLPFHGLER
jgi:inorganic pyrophosphatase